MLRILWCGFGLGITVLTVVLVTLFVPILPKLITWHDPKGLLAIFLLGGLVAGLIVFPTFAFAAYMKSSKSIVSAYYWIGVGGLVALIANLMLAVIFVPYTNFIILNSSMLGGLAGGFVYSLFHSKDTIPLMAADLKTIYVRMIDCLSRSYSKPSLAFVSA